MRLFCFGLGYSATRLITLQGERFTGIAGTVRDPGKAAVLSGDSIGGHRVAAYAFDGALPNIESGLADADVLLVSVPPGPDGDPALARYANLINRASRPLTIVYLSTIGVYGDTAGAWVDETTPPAPASARSRARLAAEGGWASLRIPESRLDHLKSASSSARPCANGDPGATHAPLDSRARGNERRGCIDCAK